MKAMSLVNADDDMSVLIDGMEEFEEELDDDEEEEEEEDEQEDDEDADDDEDKGDVIVTGVPAADVVNSIIFQSTSL